MTRWRLPAPGRAPKARFVIYGRGRSGSTLLVDLLNQHPNVTCRGELFSDPPAKPLRALRKELRRARSRTPSAFGFKLLSYQLNQLPLERPGDFLKVLAERGFHVVWLRRENLLLHALSNVRARALGWHSRRGEGYQSVQIPINLEDLLHFLRSSARLEQIELAVLGDLPRLELVYERDLEPASQHQATTDRVVSLLGLPPVTVQAQLVKLSGTRLEDLASNADEIRRALRGTEFERFLATERS